MRSALSFFFLSPANTILVHVCYEVRPVLLLLKSSKHHLGAGDVLLGVGQVNVEGLAVPGDALVNVGLCVSISSSTSRLPAYDPMKVRPLLVLAPSLHSVALGTRFREDLLTVCRTHSFL